MTIFFTEIHLAITISPGSATDVRGSFQCEQDDHIRKVNYIIRQSRITYPKWV